MRWLVSLFRRRVGILGVLSMPAHRLEVLAFSGISGRGAQSRCSALHVRWMTASSRCSPKISAATRAAMRLCISGGSVVLRRHDGSRYGGVVQVKYPPRMRKRFKRVVGGSTQDTVLENAWRRAPTRLAELET